MYLILKYDLEIHYCCIKNVAIVCYCILFLILDSECSNITVIYNIECTNGLTL